MRLYSLDVHGIVCNCPVPTERALTCPRSQQPAVQVARGQRIVQHQSSLAIHHLQDLIDSDWGVGVRVLLSCLSFYQEIRKRPRPPSLGHSQGLVMVAYATKGTD